MLASWVAKSFRAEAGYSDMSDVIDILGTSGAVGLDELSLRSSENHIELAATLEDLQSRGLIQVTGPHPERLSELTESEIRNGSQTIIRLTRRAFAAGGF